MYKNNYSCVTDMNYLRWFMCGSGSTPIAFDIETAPDEQYRSEDKAALDPHKAHIVGFSVSKDRGFAHYVPLAHKTGKNADAEQALRILADFATDPCIVKVAHNLAFETAFLNKYGIIIQPPVYDTILAAQMTLKTKNEFRKLSDSGLKTLVPELLKVDLPKFSDVAGNGCFDELDPDDWETIRYACADSDYTLQLYYLFNNWFDKYLPKHRWLIENIESPAAVYVGVMKYNGVMMDKKLMYEKQFYAQERLSELKKQIQNIVGSVDIGENAVTDELKKYLHDELKLPILKSTTKNQASADEESFVLLKEWCENNGKYSIVKLFELILEYRKWSKLKSVYIDGYLKCVNSATGRLHPDFFQLGAESGRFSCRNPNIQNQTSGGEVKVRDFIIAPEGYGLIELDYSQIEARLAAYLSRDEKLLNVFRGDKDLHAMTTAAVFGIPLSEAMDRSLDTYKHRRTVAKTTFFGFLYGIYAKSLMRNLKLDAGVETTMDECKQFLNNLSDGYEMILSILLYTFYSKNSDLLILTAP